MPDDAPAICKSDQYWHLSLRSDTLLSTIYQKWKLSLLETYSFRRFNIYVAKIEHTVEKFGQLLRQLRENNGWTQDDLAGELGVDRAYISQLERGVKNPSLKTMAKLAKVLTVKVSFAGVDLT